MKMHSKIQPIMIYILMTLAILSTSAMLSIITGCSKEIQPEKTQEPIIESCNLDKDIECIQVNTTSKIIRINIKNKMDYDMEISEIKIYKAGTCGSERLGNSTFPAILKSNEINIIQVVCNTIPSAGKVFESRFIIRYYNIDDNVLHTSKGNIIAVVNPDNAVSTK